MSMEIRALGPADAERFAGLFDAMAFEHAREWKTCYCRYYQTACDFDAWIKRTGAENRDDAVRAIRTGTMHGYVAIEDDRCVGWVNAGNALDYVRLHDDLQGICRRSHKIGLTICFVIEPGQPEQGPRPRPAAGGDRGGLRQQGYDAAIALPVDRPMAGERRYRGTMNMYREAGYVECETP
ncbi:MAG: hypothetical protein MZW92_12350 [Comamonadaceae bacterium]|nr:hypothetical protein [Comamonadaceae bacterium]